MFKKLQNLFSVILLIIFQGLFFRIVHQKKKRDKEQEQFLSSQLPSTKPTTKPTTKPPKPTIETDQALYVTCPIDTKVFNVNREPRFIEKSFQKKFIDFRSDTVTKPSKDMIDFMLRCPLGDDVFIEDPTVNRLEKYVASLFNKESGLFVCTGTMSNQLACRVHLTEPTQQIILDYHSHIYQYELGGVSYHTGCSYRTLHPKNEKYLTAKEIEENIMAFNDFHHPVTQLIAIENTMGGRVFPIEEIKKIHDMARKNKLKLHLDGARIWNASIASGVKLSEYGQYFDTVSVCLSKGLGAPIGTVLVGSEKDILKARRYRKIFGGGWRQAGLLAGCGLYAINNNWKKMKDDHKHAKYLAEELRKLGFKIENKIETNMVMVSLGNVPFSWKAICEGMEERNIRILVMGKGDSVRFALHHQISKSDIAFFVTELKQYIGK